MSQYLSKLGHEMHLIVPSNAAYPSKGGEDQSEGLKVVHRPIWEVRRYLKKKGGSVDNIFFEDKARLSFKSRLSLWARGNIFIPDARVTWYYQIRKFVHKYMLANKIDTLITTGPPHSIHLNGLYLKKKMDVEWIADFRDPWTTIEYHDKMMMSGMASRLHKKLERKVLQGADRVLTVSPSWASELQEISGRKVDVVYNGYEESLFTKPVVQGDEVFRISHMGTLRADRNPEALWKILSNLNREFVIELYGEVSEEVKMAISKEGLEKSVLYLGNVAHKDAVQAMFKANLLLLLVNKDSKNSAGRIPAKIFEYMRSGAKILLMGDTKGDAAQILRSSEAGEAFDYDDYEGISKFMSNMKGPDRIRKDDGFSREQQAKVFSQVILNSI